MLGRHGRRVSDKLEAEVPRSGASGQTLVLFALMLVVLLGFAALAVDVTRVYADLRFYRATADAAALAGAQDLQGNNTRTVSPADYSRARGHTLDSLEEQLGGSGAACGPTTANIVDCALVGSPYVVSIKTDPSPSCATCNPARAVQVTVRRPAYPLSFSGIPPFNQADWNVQTTSVAGLQYGRSYAIMTLRPPAHLGGPQFDVKDITLNASTVTVDNGDVGSNANMEYASGQQSVMTIDPDYGMYYFDTHFPPLWYPFEPFPPTPTVQQLPALIKDPDYYGVAGHYPCMTPSDPGCSGSATAPTFDDARESEANEIPAVQTAFVDPTHTAAQQAGELACAAAAADVPSQYGIATILTQTPQDVFCFQPGIYESGSGAKDAKLTVSTGHVGLLMPGTYYLKSGMDIGEKIIGGYEAGSPGVALMFDECRNTQCNFKGNNAVTIALNAGTKFPPPVTAGTAALAARDWANNPVETSGPDSPTPPLLITLLVKKDPGCYVPTSPPFEEPGSCTSANNQTIFIAGGGSLALEGVQYAPTDNFTITGGSTGTGRVGQIISWTLTYDGQTRINQEGPGGEGPGVLRIDEACSPGDSLFCFNP